MNVLVKKTSENAVIPYKTHDSDFCYDVVATSCEEIAPNIYKYGIGLAIQIERDSPILLPSLARIGTSKNISKEYIVAQSIILEKFKCNLSIDFRPRSSVWKTGLVLSNCTGTIDEDYTGEVSAVFYKVAPGEIYKVGDRIGQIKIGFTLPIEFKEVAELSETDRGSGSYGSTGK